MIKAIDNVKSRKLARTAGEIKKYRMLMKLLPAIAGFMTMTLIIVYVVTIMYNKYGSFTVTVNKFESLKYSLSLSETPDFMNTTMRLNSKASEDITCISNDKIPDNVDMINGEHNGKNYVAYTFYLQNSGKESIDCEYQVYIANMTKDIEEAVRVRLYVNGEYTDFAKTKKDGTGPEPGTTEFLTETIITREQISSLAPNAVTKFTVVIWLNGDDPECLDNIIGGQFKIDMSISILGVEQSEE